MFVGHYAVGFALKKKYREVPLWLLFVFVQLVDILAFILVLAGVERMSYNPTDNPFLRTVIEYVPYTHSLFTNIVIGLAVYFIFLKLKNKAWAAALSIGVVSHWFLDALVHQPDMPLFHDSFKVGLGLWNFPMLSFTLEILALIAAGYFLLKDIVNIKRFVFMVFLLAFSYTGMFFAPEAEATPGQASVSVLALFAIITALAYWCEPHKTSINQGR
jgi:membrane-bound metal-dependent hydrolase YbcI (DUF457 family)